MDDKILIQLCAETDFSNISKSNFEGLGDFLVESVKEMANSE